MKRATYDDVLNAPEHKVAEILDGELFLSPRPAPRHAVASSRLGGVLVPFDDGPGGPGGWWILDESELHFGDDVLVPDLAGWRRERMPVMEDVAFFSLAPHWVCEVLSLSTERIDRGRKLRIRRTDRGDRMEFIVIAHDAPGVFERRMAVRERHLATIGNLKAQGHVVYAVGLLDDSEKLAGSVIVCEFESREPLDAWLREEPYVVHGVWEQIEILCCAIGPAFRAASPPAPGFSIRPASNSDAPGVLRCLSQAFARYRDEYTPDGFRDTILDEATIRHRMTAMTVLVAVDAKDTVIGTIGFAHDGEGEGHLRGMAVVPEWQGRNVAAALLQSAESQPTALGCDRITLDTTAPLRRASPAPNSCDGVKLPGRASPPRTRATAASAASTVKVYPSGTVIVIVSSAPSFATRPQRNTRAAVRSSSLGPARRTAIFCTIRLSTSLRRRGRNGRNRRSRWMLRGDAAW